MNNVLSKVKGVVSVVADIAAIIAIIGEAADLVTKRLEERTKNADNESEKVD